MDNLNVVSVVLAFQGQPEPSSVFSILAFINAAFNLLLLVCSIIKLLKVSERNIHNGMVLLASTVGTVCSIIYFAVNTNAGAGFITLNTLYHALVWLSFISIFPFWARNLHAVGVETHPGVAKALAILAYLYALITIIVAIVTETKAAAAASSMYNLLFGRGYVSDELITFSQLMSFLFHCNWAYVVITLILLFVFFGHMSRVSIHFTRPVIAFFVVATIAVITDTAVVSSGSGITYSRNPLAIVVVNFVLVDSCNVIAMLVIVLSSGKWKNAFNSNNEEENSKV